MTDFSTSPTPLLGRLGVTAWLDEGELVLRVMPVEATSTHGSARISVVSFIVDTVAGIAIDTDPECWAFTSDMTVRLQAVPAPAFIDARATVLREGKRSAVAEVRLFDDAGASLGYGSTTFSRVPRRDSDPPKPKFDTEKVLTAWATPLTLDRPLFDAMDLRVIDAAQGVVEVDVRWELQNPAGALQGAMIAAVGEAAAEALLEARLGYPVVVTDIDVRYLRQNRTGPIRTRCEVFGQGHGTVVLVHLIDPVTGGVNNTVLVRAVPAVES